ncbi:MAG: DUF885 domain-containing protein [Cytophagales bacterium]|nr:DUF885 domain-containing protein [Cytophagales bacterium]MDW8383399.1 DUF885 domain-containing protein [Flammeovirgaceae bacterium]
MSSTEKNKKWFRRITGVILLLVIGWIINIIWFKPFSLSSFFERYFIEKNLLSPELMTRTHLYEKWTLGMLSGNLDDFSEENTKRKEAFINRSFDLLVAFKHKTKSFQEKVSIEILEKQLEDHIIKREQFANFHHEINHLDGPHVYLPDFLLNIHHIKNLKDAQNYIKRVEKIATRLEQSIQKILQNDEESESALAVKNNVVLPPRFILEHIVYQLNLFLSFDSIHQNIIYKDFLKKIEQCECVRPEAQSEFLYEIKQIIEDELVPAYQAYLKKILFLKEIADEKAGLSQYENGDIYYTHLLGFYLTEEISADSLYQMAEIEIEETEAKMREITNQLGYPSQMPINKIMQQLANDKRFMHKPNNKGELQFFDSLRHDIEEFRKKSERLFYAIPNIAVDILRMNLLMEPYSPLVEYVPCAIDKQRHAKMLFNLIDWPEIPKYRIRPLVARFIFPGHHLQVSFQIEAKHLPTFRRTIELYAFSEGWNHYAQHMALDSGFFQSPYEKLAVLYDDLLLASKILADIGIHRYGWTRQQAIQTLEKITLKPQREIMAEVDECIIFPAKATAYLYGYKKIIKLLQNWKNFRKEKFDIREFHQILLEDGCIPLNKLEQKFTHYQELPN